MQAPPIPTRTSDTPSSRNRLFGVLSRSVPEYWPEVSPLIQKALAYCDGKYDLRYIYESLMSRKMQLWVSLDSIPMSHVEACCITEIVHYPLKCICNIFLVSGKNMQNWLGFEKNIEAWARENGCRSIECYGRPGWEKTIDWEKIHTVLRKKL